MIAKKKHMKMIYQLKDKKEYLFFYEVICQEPFYYKCRREHYLILNYESQLWILKWKCETTNYTQSNWQREDYTEIFWKRLFEKCTPT